MIGGEYPNVYLIEAVGSNTGKGRVDVVIELSANQRAAGVNDEKEFGGTENLLVTDQWRPSGEQDNQRPGGHLDCGLLRTPANTGLELPVLLEYTLEI